MSLRRWHIAGLILAVVAVLGGYVVVTSLTANAADDVPLSLGRPVTVSSEEWVAFPASAAVDGDGGSRWSSGFADPQWITIDLESPAAIDRVELDWERAYASAYTIEVSLDGTTWTRVYATSAGRGGEERLTVSGVGRHVRLSSTARGTQYGVSLWEFRVYGTRSVTPSPTTVEPTPSATATEAPAPTPTQPGRVALLSYRKAGTASTSQNDANCADCSPARAFDNDPATRWATAEGSGWVDPGWIAVDLGATAQIQKVVLQWDPAYATAYQIQVSTDGTTWTGIHSVTQGKGLTETLTVNGTGRYVRMFGTARSNGYGYSLWEFQVYGTGGSPVVAPPKPADPVFPATRLVWSDEFTGAAGGRPDASKWTIDPGTGQNNEIQNYTNNENAALDGNGALVIEARKQASNGRDYTSHRMNTGSKFAVQYGRVEARIKVPKGNGLWPAFWMMGDDFRTGRPWPYNGEIDIMEVLGRNTSEAYSTLHAPAYNGAGGYGQKYATTDLSQDFHVWAAEWDSKGIRFFLDDKLVFTADKAAVESTRGPWVYDHEFYLILNLAVGGDFPGPVDGSTPFPSRMYVDYVRVYQ